MATDFLPSIKVILVGASGVGKTSLVSAFFDQQFEKQTLPTVAPAFCSAEVSLSDGRKIELRMWDTAGQEQYQSVSQMFYRDAQVCLICYDLEAKDAIQTWYDAVKAQVPDCIMLLVLTKSDTLTENQLEEARVEGKELTRVYHASGFYTTSARIGLGVKELFQSCASCIDQISPTSNPLSNTVKTNNSRGSDGCC